MSIWSWMGGAVFGLFTATTLYAGAITLLETGSKPRTALISVPAAGAVRSSPQAPASLFIGRHGTSLFAEIERVEPVMAATGVLMNGARSGGMSGPAVTVIRQIIEQAESSRSGYDAVQHGARIKPSRRPTQMTVAEIYKWIDNTPGQPHAIGRYQFIPSTLRRVMETINASPQQRFTPGLQDRLADVLLAEAGYHEAKQGALPRRAFMNNLAKIWAGLPNETGRSHYDGYAGNKASMSWDRFDAQMAQVFAD